jgi:hypothetical protein
MMDLYIKFIFGIISCYAIVVLNFTIFKAPIKANDKQIVAIAVAIGLVNVYLKFVANSNLFSIIQIVVYIVLLSMLRKYPILYGTIFALFGMIAASLVDALLSFLVLQSGIIQYDVAFNNTGHFVAMHSLLTIFCLMIAWVLSRYQIGFSFVKARFSGNVYLRKSTYIWAGILILVVTILQLSIQNFALYNINSLILIAVSIGLIVLIIYSYFQNKKSLLDRYGENMKVS